MIYSTQIHSNLEGITVTLDYADVYRSVRKHLLTESPKSTNGITAAIKSFFRKEYSPQYTVMASGGLKEDAEYLVDLLVAGFHPRKAIKQGTLDLTLTNAGIHLAVESELGGTGGTSAFGVMKNVVEDYLKLLAVRADYRVLFFTSLPFAREKGSDYVLNRVEKLLEIYRLWPAAEQGLLLIHLGGTQRGSNQAKAVVDNSSIRGFLISPNGDTSTEIRE